MLNENKTSTKNKVLTIISAILYVVISVILTYITIDITGPAFRGEENASLGIAVGLIVFIMFCAGALILYIAPTVISIVCSTSIKCKGESKALFIINIILAILPAITLIINIIIYDMAINLVSV